MRKPMSFEKYFERRTVAEAMRDLQHGNPEGLKRLDRGDPVDFAKASYAGYLALARGGDRIIGDLEITIRRAIEYAKGNEDSR